MVKAMIIFIIIGYLIGCIHGSKVAQFLSGVDLKRLAMAMRVPQTQRFLLDGNTAY